MAKKIQGANLKDEKTVRDFIKQIANIAGKEVSKEKEDKIVKTILEDKVPKDVDKYI